MNTFILLIVLLDPRGATVQVQYSDLTKGKCDAQRTVETKALSRDPKGYTLVRADCIPQMKVEK